MRLGKLSAGSCRERGGSGFGAGAHVERAAVNMERLNNMVAAAGRRWWGRVDWGNEWAPQDEHEQREERGAAAGGAREGVVGGAHEGAAGGAREGTAAAAPPGGEDARPTSPFRALRIVLHEEDAKRMARTREVEREVRFYARVVSRCHSALERRD